ncbi:MAG: Jag N-terminal domain-containing protein [Clostridia bacterium]|nr:Jag N-terminal domain-containing protein [Clostridia bacterium]
MLTIQATGKSVDAAIYNGLGQLGLSIDEVNIEVIQQASKGILGIGAKPAIVKLTEKPKEEVVIPDFSLERERRNERRDNRDRRENRDNRESRDNRDNRDNSENRERRDNRDERRQNSRPERRERPERAAQNTEAKPGAAETLPEGGAAASFPAAAEQNQQQTPQQNRERRDNRDYNRDRRGNRQNNRGDNRRQTVELEPAVEINYTEEAAENEPSAKFVSGLIERMKIEGKVLAARDDDAVRLRVDCGEMGVLIGHRGETLDAVQYLTGLVVNRNRKTDGYIRVTINTEDYREKREETLVRLAKRIASQVKSNGSPRTLEPMNPYERRIIHSALQKNPHVTTHSEGDEPNRRVVISPKRRENGNYRRPNRDRA